MKRVITEQLTLAVAARDVKLLDAAVAAAVEVCRACSVRSGIFGVLVVGLVVAALSCGRGRGGACEC